MADPGVEIGRGGQGRAPKARAE